MTDELKDRVVIALDKYRDKQTMTAQRPTSISFKIVGNGNVQACGDININARKITRNIIKPGPEHITEKQAYKLRELVKKAVEIESKAGGEQSRLFRLWWSRIYKRFEVTSYKLIPSIRGEEAISYMQQEVAKLRPKLRRTDNEAWRNDLYAAIWSRTKELKHNKSWVYQFFEKKTGKKIESLTQLGERDLKKLHTLIMSQKKAT